MGGSGLGHYAGEAHVKTKFLKCPGCGHIHIGMAEADAADEVRTMAEYLTRLEPADRQRSYGDRTPTIDDYKKCHRCGASSERLSRPSATKIPA